MYTQFPFEPPLDQLAYLTEDYADYLQLQEIVNTIKSWQLEKLQQELQETIQALLQAVENNWDYAIEILTVVAGIEDPKNTYDAELSKLVTLLRTQYIYGKFGDDFHYPLALLQMDQSTYISTWFSQLKNLPEHLVSLAQKHFCKKRFADISLIKNANDLIEVQPFEMMRFVFVYIQHVIAERNTIPLAPNANFQLNNSLTIFCEKYTRQDIRKVIKLRGQHAINEFKKLEIDLYQPIYPEHYTIEQMVIQEKNLILAEHLNSVNTSLPPELLPHLAINLDLILDAPLIQNYVDRLYGEDDEILNKTIDCGQPRLLKIVLRKTENSLSDLHDAVVYACNKEKYSLLAPLILLMLNQIVGENHDEIQEDLTIIHNNDVDKEKIKKNCSFMIAHFLTTKEPQQPSYYLDLQAAVYTQLQKEKYGYCYCNADFPSDAALKLFCSDKEHFTVRDLSDFVGNVRGIQTLPDHQIRLLNYLYTLHSDYFFHSSKSLVPTLSNWRLEFEADPLQFISNNKTLEEFEYQLKRLPSYYAFQIEYHKQLLTWVGQGKTMWVVVLGRHMLALGLLNIQQLNDYTEFSYQNESQKKSRSNLNDELFKNKLGFIISEQSDKTMNLLNSEVQSLTALELSALNLISSDAISLRYYHVTGLLKDIKETGALIPASELLISGEIEKSTAPTLFRNNVFFSIGAGRAIVTNFLRTNYDVIQINIREAINRKIIQAKQVWTSMHYSALNAERVYFPILFQSPCKQYGTIYRMEHISAKGKSFKGVKYHQFYYVKLKPTFALISKQEVKVTHDMDVFQGDPAEFIAKKLIWFLRMLKSPLLPVSYSDYLETLYLANQSLFKSEIENLINTFFSPYNFETKISQSFSFDVKKVENLNSPYYLRFLENPYAITNGQKVNVTELKKILKSGTKEAFAAAYRGSLIYIYNNHEMVMFAINEGTPEQVNWLLDLGVDLHNHNKDYILAAAQRILFCYFYNHSGLVEAKFILKLLLITGTMPCDVSSPNIRTLANPANTVPLVANLIILANVIRDLDLLSMILNIGSRDALPAYYYLDLAPMVLVTNQADYQTIVEIQSAKQEDLITLVETKKNISRVVFIELMKVIYRYDDVEALDSLTLDDDALNYHALLLIAVKYNKPNIAANCLSVMSEHGYINTDLSPSGQIWIQLMHVMGMLENPKIQTLLISLKVAEECHITEEYIYGLTSGYDEFLYRLLIVSPETNSFTLHNLNSSIHQFSQASFDSMVMCVERLFQNPVEVSKATKLINFIADIWIKNEFGLTALNINHPTNFAMELVLVIIQKPLSRKQVKFIAEFLQNSVIQASVIEKLFLAQKPEIIIELTRSYTTESFDAVNQILFDCDEIGLLNCLQILYLNPMIKHNYSKKICLLLIFYFSQENAADKLASLWRFILHYAHDHSSNRVWLPEKLETLSADWFESKIMFNSLLYAIECSNDLISLVNTFKCPFPLLGKIFDRLANNNRNIFYYLISDIPQEYFSCVTDPQLKQMIYQHYRQSNLRLVSEALLNNQILVPADQVLDLYKANAVPTHMMFAHTNENPLLIKLFCALFEKNDRLFEKTYQTLSKNSDMATVSQKVLIDFPHVLATLVVLTNKQQITRRSVFLQKFFTTHSMTLLNCAVLANNEHALRFLLSKNIHRLSSENSFKFDAMNLALIFNRTHLAIILVDAIAQGDAKLINIYQKLILIKLIEPDVYSGFTPLKTENQISSFCTLYLKLADLREDNNDLKNLTIAMSELLQKLIMGSKGDVLQKLIAIQELIVALFGLQKGQNFDFHVGMDLLDENNQTSPTNYIAHYEIVPSLREAAATQIIDAESGDAKIVEKPMLTYSKTAIEWGSPETFFTESGTYEGDYYGEQKNKRAAPDDDDLQVPDARRQFLSNLN